MADQSKTTQELTAENAALKERIRNLEKGEAGIAASPKHDLQSEGFLRHLVETIPDIVLHTDLQGQIVFVNDRGLELTGYHREEVVGKNMLSFVVPEDRERAILNTMRMMDQLPGPKEYRLILKNGRISPFELNGDVIRKEDGIPDGMVFIVRSITERRQAEEAVRESNERFKSIVAVSNTGAWQYHGNRDYLWCSAEYFTMLGRDPKDFVLDGRSNLKEAWIDLMHPDDRQRASVRFAEYLRGGSVGMYENSFRFRRADGEWAWIWSRGQTLRNADGSITDITVGTHIDITDRKRAEESLKESEEKYRTLAENALESIVIAQDGMIKFSNKRLSDVTGYTMEELNAIPFTDLLHPDDRQLVFDRYLQRIEGKEVSPRYAFRFLGAKGDTRWADMNVALISWEGRPASLCFVTDITERKQAQEALVASEEKFRHIFEKAEEGISVVRDEVFEFINPAFQRILGHSMDILTSVSIESFIHPDDKAMVVERNRRRLQGEQVETGYDFRVISSDGTVKWLTIHSQVIDWEGTPANLSFLTDITERKRAEEALRESEERYRNILNSIQESYYEVDLKGNVTFFNYSIIKILGYSEEELEGMNFRNFIASESVEEVLKAYHQVFLTGVPLLGLESEVVTSDGGRIAVEISVSLRNNTDGESLGFRGVVRDITDRKRAEEEKRNLERNLARAQKLESVGTLAGGIAHDFNNLLMAIQGNTSLIMMDLDPSHPHYERLSHIEETVASGADLTMRLLGFSRGGRYEVKPASINEILKKSSAMFGRTKKEVSLHQNYSQDPCIAEVDRSQMEQVFMNLLVNAWQAMPEGGNIFIETDRVFLDETRTIADDAEPGFYVKVNVTDTGTGMDEQTRERIFDPFFTTKGMTRGTGLGLASVYGIISGHRGMINVYSEPGHGTTFTIYLPASEKDPAEEMTTTGEVLKGTETILLVDDEQMVLDVSRDILESLGYRVFTAGSGQEAVAIYIEKKDEIELVVLDMIMPGISGSGTFDQLREINPDVKVLLASGYSINGQAQDIIDQGCDGFIQKPFLPDQLSRSVREVLDSQRAL